MMQRFLIAVACSLLWITSAHAQTCSGGISFGSAPIQVGGSGEFSSTSHSLFVGAGAGNETFFGRAGVQLTSVSGIDAGAKGLLGTVGAEFTLNPAKRIYVCPMLMFLRIWGPNSEGNITSSVVNFGGTVGFVAKKTGQATIVPTFGLSFDHISTNGSYENQPLSSGSSYGIAQFGAGVIFNDRLSLIPSLFVPFHYGPGEAVFSVLIAARIGR